MSAATGKATGHERRKEDRAGRAVVHVHLEIKNGVEIRSDGGQLTGIGNEAAWLILAVNIHNRSHPKEMVK